MTAALERGGPEGPIGDLRVAGIELDRLSIALKRALRCGFHTPRAASLVYTGGVVRDLRAYLRPPPLLDVSMAPSPSARAVSASPVPELASGGAPPSPLTKAAPSPYAPALAAEVALQPAADWLGVEETLRVVAHNNARVVAFATLGRSDGVAPSARIPTASLGIVEVPPYTADPAVLRESAVTLAPEGEEPPFFPCLPARACAPALLLLLLLLHHGALSRSSLPSPRAGIAEVERIEQECRYHAVMDLCRAALSTGGASGSAGALDLKGVTVAGLAGAIDASRMLAATTPHALHVRSDGGGRAARAAREKRWGGRALLSGFRRALTPAPPTPPPPPSPRQLTDLCRLMWQSRTAVLEDDWATMESLLGACGGVLGLSGAPLPPGCAVPPAVLTEMALYRAESNNRKAVAALSRGIVAGAPEGEVGRLSLSSVDVRPVSTRRLLLSPPSLSTARASACLLRSSRRRCASSWPSARRRPRRAASPPRRCSCAPCASRCSRAPGTASARCSTTRTRPSSAQTPTASRRPLQRRRRQQGRHPRPLLPVLLRPRPCRARWARGLASWTARRGPTTSHSTASRRWRSARSPCCRCGRSMMGGGRGRS